MTTEFMDMYLPLPPCYGTEPLENITDAYLGWYIWHKGDHRPLFPNLMNTTD